MKENGHFSLKLGNANFTSVHLSHRIKYQRCNDFYLYIEIQFAGTQHFYLSLK